MTPRALPEWIGKTPDTKIPQRVLARIFDRENGTCHICKGKIHTGKKWQADHHPALINGGENRESKIFPAHEICHTDKTKKDVADKAKVAEIRAKFTGAKRPKAQIKSRPFDKTGKERKPVNSLPPKPLFAMWPASSNPDERDLSSD